MSLVSPLTSAVRRCTLLALPIAALALAGCTSQLNMESVKKAVSDGINAQLALPIDAVSCPPERAQKAGDVFECVATPVGGGRLTVSVTQDDAAGNVTWKVVKTEGLLDLKTVEESIVTGLKEKAQVDATASCGGRWKPAKAGDTFDCVAKTTSGEEVGILVSATDDEGNISWGTK